MRYQKEGGKEDSLTCDIFVDFVATGCMNKGLIISRGREILFIDGIHIRLLFQVLVYKYRRKVMIVSAHIPAYCGLGPLFIPLGIIEASKYYPDY